MFSIVNHQVAEDRDRLWYHMACHAILRYYLCTSSQSLDLVQTVVYDYLATWMTTTWNRVEVIGLSFSL